MAEPFYLPELAITPSVDFHVSNLGRIPSADFDIKPLTVFIGKANTNKTWTAYALYGLLRSMAKSPRSIPFGQQIPQCAQLDRAIEEVAGETAQEIIALFSSEQQSFSIEVARARVFSVAHPIGTDLKLSLRNDDIAALLAVDPSVLGGAQAVLSIPTDGFIERGRLKSLVINWNKQYWMVNGIAQAGYPVHSYVIPHMEKVFSHETLKQQFAPSVRWLAMASFDETIAFPAERKGITTFLHALDFLQRATETRPNLNVASLDYLRFLYGAQRSLPARGGEDSKVVTLLEQEVMKGRADFQGQTESRVFSYLARRGPVVQMNASASFVRSMAGLDVYLRMVTSNDVIVIDEPEMNAHPEAQLKLVELFAILANEGRHVIVTTHSPYFVDHLNNLMQGAALDESAQDRLVGSLKLRDKQAFIPSERVSAYLFNEDGTTRNLVEDGAIDLESFAVESDYVANLGRTIAQMEGDEQDGAQ